MTDRDHLLAAVLADPADDGARLVLADLLRDGDDPDAQARGRFLWAGVTASRFRYHDVIEDPLYYAAQNEIAAVAAAGFPARWAAGVGVGPRTLAAGDWLWDNAHDRVTVRVGAAVVTFTRGMAAELAVTLADWLALAPAALAAWPVERVRDADVPGLVFAIDPPDSARGGWRLAARLRVPRRNVPLSGPRVVPTAVSPLPVLEERAEWRAEESFPDRGELAAGAAAACAALAADLREAAGDRWPPAPRARR